jgi:formylmethanofuran dehydrogenase subunit B
MRNVETTTSGINHVEHVACLACGCLCDDILVKLEGNRVVEAERACSIGRPWFLSSRPGAGYPTVSIEGKPSGLAEAIHRAAEILQSSKSPVIWGLSGTTIEGVASALSLADRIGGVVDIAGSAGGEARLRAFQRVGQVSASLGEVKDRADLVVFWGVDPLVTHPRHWERYSVDPRGRFIPEGRAGRFVIVVDAQPTETSRAADLFVKIDPDRQAETLEGLRALVRGVAIDPDRVRRSTGLPFATLETLAERFQEARYGALFFGPSIGEGASGSRATEGLLKLVVDLNEGRRFVALEMGDPGNRPGASAVLSWQSGAPSSVDYGPGYPRHLPGEATLIDRLKAGEVDALLVVGDDPTKALPPEVLPLLEKIPSILIAPGATVPDLAASVAFDVARPGLEVGGTAARVDGVMLPLKALVDSGLPTDCEVLVAIRQRIEISPSSRFPEN